MIYDICYFLCKGICKILFRFRVVGEENVPKRGSVILASNHVSYLDPIFVGISLPRKIHYMAKEEIFRNPLLSWFMRKLQAFPVSRDRVGPTSMKRALQVIKKEKMILLFPEGTRGDGKTLLRAKPGIGAIAEKSGAPIVPVFLQGPEKVLPRGSWRLRFHQVTVGFGLPLLPPSPRGGESKKNDYEDLATGVMEGIERVKKAMEGGRVPTVEWGRGLPIQEARRSTFG